MNSFKVGDKVWYRPPRERMDRREWLTKLAREINAGGPGTIIHINSGYYSVKWWNHSSGEEADWLQLATPDLEYLLRAACVESRFEKVDNFVELVNSHET